MAISFNTSATGDSGGATAANVTITIPAGVLSGDVCLVVASGTFGSSGATLSISSTGTTPTLISQTQVSFSAAFHNGGLWYFVASGTDAGKVITISMSAGANPFWSAGLGAYTGASNSAPIDVNNIASLGTAGGTLNTPTLTTGVAGDWSLQLAAVATSGNSLTEPTSTTSRFKHIPSSGIAADLCDSNASVGPAGTSIGGGTYSSGSGNIWYVVWTVGLAPPSGAISGTVQPRTTAAVAARRRLARAVTGFIPVATVNTRPAGTVQPLTTIQVPRRRPARIVTGFIPVATVNTRPAGTVQPISAQPAPRRKPARGYSQFTPVRTTNPAFVAVPQPPPKGGGMSWFKRSLLWADL